MSCTACKSNEVKEMIALQEKLVPSICSTQLPFVKGTVLPVSTIPPPSIFTLSNYDKRLEKCQCNDVYHQYTPQAIHESLSLKRPLRPIARIAQMKTPITFFKSSPSTPSTTFSITYPEYKKQVDTTLPMYFSWMDNEHITRPQSQGMCGSCWAIAVSTCLNDVFVVQKNIPNPQLSSSYVLSCMPQDQCNGGDPLLALHDIQEKGIKPKPCSNDNWNQELLPPDMLNKLIPPCNCTEMVATFFPSEIKVLCIPPVLTDLSSNEALVLQSYLSHLYGSTDSMDVSSIPYEHVQTMIKHHIYTYGPVVSGFHVFKNFLKGKFSETNDIYIETNEYQGVNGIRYDNIEEDWIGSHAIVIVGWGTDMVKNHQIDYWLVRNSWGTDWGLGGLFKIAMYGTKPYYNRISQFEYPSLVTTDTGYGVTGGVLLIKSGEIKKPSVQSTQPIQPIQPIQSTQPTQPIQPTQPVQCTQPIQSTQPIQYIQYSITKKNTLPLYSALVLFLLLFLFPKPLLRYILFIIILLLLLYIIV